MTTTVEGQDAHKYNKTIDQTFQVTDRVIKSTRKAGITTDFDSYHSYVHVDSDLMKRLDKIYRQHFQEDDGVTLLQCFNVIGDDQCKDRLTEYIVKVEKELEETLLRLDAKGLHEKGDPHRHGIRGAGINLKVVFAIADGWLCLPLATVSMLDDLKKFILADENIIIEVRSIFPFHADVITPNLTKGCLLVRWPHKPYHGNQRAGSVRSRMV